MLLLEAVSEVFSTLDEAGVVQSNCPSPLDGALDLDPLYIDSIIITSESHLCVLDSSVLINHSFFYHICHTVVAMETKLSPFCSLTFTYSEKFWLL